MPSGAHITVGTDGKVTLSTVGKLVMDAPVTIFMGSIEAAGDVTAGTISLQNHTHVAPDAGGTTSEPTA